jgi:hypothetical protein
MIISQSLSGYVSDVFPRMSIERLFETLLIHNMANKPNAAPNQEETIDKSKVDYFCDLRLGKNLSRVEHIKERGANTAVDIKNQIALFGSGQFLHFEGIV